MNDIFGARIVALGQCHCLVKSISLVLRVQTGKKAHKSTEPTTDTLIEYRYSPDLDVSFLSASNATCRINTSLHLSKIARPKKRYNINYIHFDAWLIIYANIGSNYSLAVQFWGSNDELV